MKKFFGFVLVLVVIASGFLTAGCEDNSGRYQTDQDYNNYNNTETYVSVEVRNDHWGYICIFVGNAEYAQVEPGYSQTVYRSLIGNEKISITIWFLDYEGNPIAHSSEYRFGRNYSYYHMDVRSPPDGIKTY